MHIQKLSKSFICYLFTKLESIHVQKSWNHNFYQLYIYIVEVPYVARGIKKDFWKNNFRLFYPNGTHGFLYPNGTHGFHKKISQFGPAVWLAASICIHTNI